MSTFTLKFFAKLREETGQEEMVVSVNDVNQLSQLKPYLIEQHPEWAEAFSVQLMSAVNQTMVTGDTKLNAGDEVALFPPVTGG